MTIYLYHKRHTKTGLNYFGKTKNSNVIKYLGSGVYWLNHLRIHGETIETVKIWTFESQEECSKFAIEFSIIHDIVKSKDWANLCIEDGIGGGDLLSQLPADRYKELCEKRSKKTKASWVKRNKEAHAIHQSKIWKNRDTVQKDLIYSKIAETLKNKTPKEREVTLAKRKATENLRAPLICPHCGLASKGVSNMNRYHFDRCKKLTTRNYPIS